MKCQACKSSRILHANGKCSDRFYAFIGDNERDGYVPGDLNIGGGDTLYVKVCLDCGQLQGKWPLPPSGIETGSDCE